MGIKSREIYEAPAAVDPAHRARRAREPDAVQGAAALQPARRATSWRRPPTTASGSARCIATCASTSARRSASSTARSGCASTTAARSSSAGAATTRCTTGRSRPTTPTTRSTTPPRSASSASSGCRCKTEAARHGSAWTLDRAAARRAAGDRHRRDRVGAADGRSRPEPVSAPMKAWGGRFSTEPDAVAADFGRSIEVDAGAGARRHRGLDRPRRRARAGRPADRRRGRAPWSTACATLEADVRAGTARVGPGARGRPPQPRDGARGHGSGRWPASSIPAARATTRWRRTCGCGCSAGSRRSTPRCVGLERALVEPGAARTRRPSCPATRTSSRPSRCCFAHHLLAYVEMLERDRGRLADALRRADVSPLGSGALAGAGFPLDREAVAAELGFDGVTRNSIDAVGDRDFVVETLAAAALGDDPPVAPGRGAGVVVATRASASCASPTPSRPARR